LIISPSSIIYIAIIYAITLIADADMLRHYADALSLIIFADAELRCRHCRFHEHMMLSLITPCFRAYAMNTPPLR